MFKLRTLGGLEMIGCDLPGRRPLVLAAYLAIEGRQRRGRLAELFFSETVDPLNQLSVNLTRLRRHLRTAGATDALQADASTVGLDLATDHAVLLQALELHDVSRAVELYAGPFLAGEEERVTDDLASWILAVREELANRLLREAVTTCGRLAADGRATEAAALAEAARRSSETEIGDPVLHDALREILVTSRAAVAPAGRRRTNGAPAGRPRMAALRTLRAIPPTNLVGPPALVVGRERERLEVAGLLRRLDCRLVTLVGEGGVGKSWLGRQVADDCLASEAFPDGVLALDTEGATVEDLTARFVQAIEASGLGASASFGDASRAGHRERVLVLVDGVGESDSALAQVGDFVTTLLRAWPAARILVTSVRRLGVPSEIAYLVEGVGENEAEDGSAFGSAADLFLARARSVHGNRIVGADDVAGIRRLARLVGGHPLALSLAAAFAGTSGPAEIAELVEADPDALGAFRSGVPERSRSPRARFDHALAGMAAEERGLLLALSYFEGSFSREGAVEVAGAGVFGLAGLQDLSLLRTQANGRFRLTALARLFARKDLEATPELLTRVSERHVAYYADLPRRHYQQAFGARQAAIQQLLLDERPNTLLAFRRALARGDSEAARSLARGIYALYGRMRWTSEALTLADEGLEALADSGTPGLVGELLAMRAMNLMWTGRLEEAATEAQEALDVLLPAGEFWGARNAYTALAHVALSKKNAVSAEHYFDLARSALPAEHPAAFKAAAGMVQLAAGKLEVAVESLRHAAVDSRVFEDRGQEVVSRYHLAGALFEKGELAQARREYGLVMHLAAGSLPHYEEAGRLGVARVLALLGDKGAVREQGPGQPAPGVTPLTSP